MQSEIIAEELKLQKFPAGPRDSQPRYAARLAAASGANCDCPKCRARRGEPVDDWDDDEDDEDIWDEDEDDEDFGDPLQGIPAAIAGILDMLPLAERQQILNAIERGEDPLKVVDRITKAVGRVAPDPRPRGSKSKVPRPSPQTDAKKQKTVSTDEDPIQGSLF